MSRNKLRQKQLFNQLKSVEKVPNIDSPAESSYTPPRKNKLNQGTGSKIIRVVQSKEDKNLNKKFLRDSLANLAYYNFKSKDKSIPEYTKKIKKIERNIVSVLRTASLDCISPSTSNNQLSNDILKYSKALISDITKNEEYDLVLEYHGLNEETLNDLADELYNEGYIICANVLNSNDKTFENKLIKNIRKNLRRALDVKLNNNLKIHKKGIESIPVQISSEIPVVDSIKELDDPQSFSSRRLLSIEDNSNQLKASTDLTSLNCLGSVFSVIAILFFLVVGIRIMRKKNK
ncbi:hypothetical protein TUBRATIS_29240 [Tubulinosema ratisbonensis]|uniref:Uncharacterized protein n=1 Tax=Tubulinosema ratisbonensis TaxID=291195 RepID=A0A437AHU0_9MICR|nr:hypothetical protein TUBRATIS_29240 [Tubulinosema ratisbonensis]